MTQALFHFPDQAKVDRVVAKNKIYEHGVVSNALRDKFVKQIDQIRWQYKLAPETINLTARPEAPEIQIFDIELKAPVLANEALAAIDRAIPFPIIFQLHHQQQIRMVAAYKRPSQAEAGKWVLGNYYATEWQPNDSVRQPLPLALDLLGLYEQLLRTLLPYPARAGEHIADQITRLETLLNLNKRQTKLQHRLNKEVQFNRKVVLNTELRQLREEIAKYAS